MQGLIVLRYVGKFVLPIVFFNAEDARGKGTQRTFRFESSLKVKNLLLLQFFLFWFFSLFVNDVNLWITLTTD
jgi:hypothetical protein